VSLVLAVVGCSSTGANTYDKKLGKLAPTMLNTYMEAYGCNKIVNTEIVGALPSKESDEIKLTKEHWRVTGCGKTHDLELTLSKDGNHVSTQKLN
jgi:hypothetical protein